MGALGDPSQKDIPALPFELIQALARDPNDSFATAHNVDASELLPSIKTGSPLLSDVNQFSATSYATSSAASQHGLEASQSSLNAQDIFSDDENDDFIPRETFAYDLHSRKRPMQPRKLFWAEDTDAEEDSETDLDDAVGHMPSFKSDESKPRRNASFPHLPAATQNSSPTSPRQVRIDTSTVTAQPMKTAVSATEPFSNAQEQALANRNRSRSEPSIPAFNNGKQHTKNRSGSILRNAQNIPPSQNSIAKDSSIGVVIAVIGPKGVGKSTVISRISKRKMGYKIISTDIDGNAISSYTTTTSIASGITKTVEILEIDSAILQYSEQGLIWPASWPVIEGVMICYDATNKQTLGPLSKMLNGFWLRGGCKMIVLACKSANGNASENVIDPNLTNQICSAFNAGLVELTGGIDDSQNKMRNAFKWIVRAIAEVKGEFPEDKLKTSKRYSKAQMKRMSHARKQVLLETDNESSAPTSPQAQTATLPTFERSSVSPQARALSPTGSIKSTRSTSPVHSNKFKIPDVDMYHSRDSLIDKFLYAAVAENDEPFVSAFIIIFRKFARPTEVLNKLFERFNFVASKIDVDSVLAQFAQMRLCAVLNTWMQAYPSDFAHYYASPGSILKPFLEKMLFQPHLNHYAVEMLPLLKTIERSPTDNEAWALPDSSSGSVESPIVLSSTQLGSAPSNVSLSSLPMSPNSTNRSTNLNSPSGVDTPDSLPDSPLISMNRSRGTSDAGTTFTAVSAISQNSDNISSKKLSRQPSTKEASLLDVSNQLGNSESREVAYQITRLTWQIFADICPRDLIRYVLAPRSTRALDGAAHKEQKNPVARSIRFLNFLSDWVASLVLIQPKPKGRARLFEKFIQIASSLRDMENFDSLMGILCGLNSQPVYRLDSDLEQLKDKPEYKRFRSLNRLMSNSKSFSAYRMALSSSSPAVIPYLGCHLQDITKVNEAKDDNRNGLANWTKCSQLAKSAAVVSNCMKSVPTIPLIEDVEKLIVDVPVHSLEDDVLYSISYAHKPRVGDVSSQSQKLKRFLDHMLPHSLPDVGPPSKIYQAD